MLAGNPKPEMQPLPPAGSSGPYLSNLSAPATPGGANRSAPAKRQDGVELNSNRQPPLMQRPPGEARSRLEPSPRPWPPAAEHQPRTTALAALASRGQPATASQALPGGALNAALFGQLSGPADPWRATPTPSGWTVPRNPDRRPLEARDPFEVLEGCQDLPELRLVPSCWGNIEALWLQWPEEVLDPAWSAQVAVFHDLFTRMPEQVRFEVVAEGLAEARLRAQMSQWAVARPERVRIHTLALRSSESLLYEPLTLWARDGAVLAESLGKPVLVMRETTERPEGVSMGTAKLVGTDPAKILTEAARLLEDADAYRAMSQAINPYGDGHAAERIVQALRHYFGLGERPAAFDAAR